MSRDAVDKMAARLADTQRKAGLRPTGESVHREAQRIARDAERRDPKIKAGNRGGER